MKYGLVLYNFGSVAAKTGGYNVGDPVQAYVLRKLYREMNVKEEDIVYINICDFATYDGEYVLLPMLGFAIGGRYAQLPLSPKIIPIFISSHFLESDLTEETVAYLRCYAPIGCRDEYTLKTMQKYNIPAYLSGCITAIMDKRNDACDRGEVYCVDVPEKLKEHIPQELLECAKVKSHLLDIGVEEMNEEDAFRLAEASEKILMEYRDNAKLVISSRLHALMPCIAMGIPVIAVFENISHRFSWLDKYIPLYTEDQFAKIDWNPEIVEYENTKNKLKDMFKKVISEAADKYKVLYEVSDYYENRTRARYGNRYYNALKDLFNETENFEYAIWGCGLIGNNAYNIMKDLYPKAKLKVAIDEFKEGMWQGVNIIKSSQIKKEDDYFIIIATYSGREQALHVMKKLGRKDTTDYVYIGTING